jgi:hypothetical protein
MVGRTPDRECLGPSGRMGRRTVGRKDPSPRDPWHNRAAVRRSFRSPVPTIGGSMVPRYLRTRGQAAWRPSVQSLGSSVGPMGARTSERQGEGTGALPVDGPSVRRFDWPSVRRRFRSRVRPNLGSSVPGNLGLTALKFFVASTARIRASLSTALRKRRSRAEGRAGGLSPGELAEDGEKESLGPVANPRVARLPIPGDVKDRRFNNFRIPARSETNEGGRGLRYSVTRHQVVPQ